MKKKITPQKVKEILDDPFYVLESKIRGMFAEQDEKAQHYRDQILTKMDAVMGELEDHRIEQAGIKNDIKALKKTLLKLIALFFFRGFTHFSCLEFGQDFI